MNLKRNNVLKQSSDWYILSGLENCNFRIELYTLFYAVWVPKTLRPRNKVGVYSVGLGL